MMMIMDCLATVKRHMGEDLPEIPVHAKKTDI